MIINYLLMAECSHYFTGCNAAYKMSDYPQYNHLNSQTVEQSNSCLKRIKSSLSYMNKKNFLDHCALYLWYHNQRKRISL